MGEPPSCPSIRTFFKCADFAIEYRGANIRIRVIETGTSGQGANLLFPSRGWFSGNEQRLLVADPNLPRSHRECPRRLDSPNTSMT